MTTTKLTNINNNKNNNIEHQQQLQHSTEIHLNALIVAQIQHIQDKSSKLNIAFKFPETLPMHMKGDAFLLGQAIYNLLENALDFSPINSVINVQLLDYQTYRQISVRDTGVGVPDYAIDKVFDKFYSLPRPSTNLKSTGLGLNFVREVVKLHGGSITLQNHEWGGAEAVITLPKT